jgi:hypothetical protein
MWLGRCASSRCAESCLLQVSTFVPGSEWRLIFSARSPTHPDRRKILQTGTGCERAITSSSSESCGDRFRRSDGIAIADGCVTMLAATNSVSGRWRLHRCSQLAAAIFAANRTRSGVFGKIDRRSFYPCRRSCRCGIRLFSTWRARFTALWPHL